MQLNVKQLISRISVGLLSLVTALNSASAEVDGGETTRIPNFTSSTYEQVFRGEKPSSYLPYWHGFHFWHDSVAPRVIPQLLQWTEHLYTEVSKAENLITVDPPGIRHFCPKYVSLDREKRILFWVRLISIIASFESNYKYWETYLEPTMSGVRSAGLLQISAGSSQIDEYNCSMISKNPVQGLADLKDPKKNMSCGVRIMNYWIGRDRVFVDYVRDSDGDYYWRGLARYWGVFRHQKLKTDDDGYFDEIAERRAEWQQSSRRRDARLGELLKTARRNDEPWGHWHWRARSTVPHPSLLESQFENEEQHRLTSILRLANQTGFCF